VGNVSTHAPNAARNRFKPWEAGGCHICSHRKDLLPRIQTFEPAQLSNLATEHGQRSNAGGGLQSGTCSNG
jgi:hypothetical protein